MMKKKDAKDYYQTSDPLQYGLSKGYAKQMRHEQTLAERWLWDHLRANALGVHFRRQHPIGTYITDFACLSERLVIEVDGEYHEKEEQQKWDQRRTDFLEAMDFTVLRFPNDVVLNDINFVIHQIRQYLPSSEESGDSDEE